MHRFNRCDPLRWTKVLFVLVIALCQVACQLPRQSTRLIVASAGKINSLDPAKANTFGALQLLSALG
ncbi:MAG TPA: ABC transporter substrate-binding protein, partial [Prochlorococcus sp.]